MSENAIPIVFDRPLQRRRLERAIAREPATFLLDAAVDDVALRVGAVSRDFRSICDLGTPSPALSARLATDRPLAAVVRAAPVPAVGRRGGIVADEEALPFAAGAFDLVVSALSLQWVNDLPGTLVQVRRCLAPDGLFLACLVGGQSLHELRTVFAEAELAATGGASPRVAPFADLRDLGGLMQRAGFALPVTDVDRVRVRYATLFDLVADLRAMGATNALAARSRRPLTRTVMAEAARLYAARFADPDGRIPATFEIVWLSGWAPHESQQKPLRPGSAQRRLADVLGTQERPAGEKAGG